MIHNARFGPNTPHTIGTSAVEVNGQHNARRYWMIQNNGPGDIYVDFGRVATASTGVKVGAGEAWQPDVVPTDAVSVIASESNTAVVVVEV